MAQVNIRIDDQSREALDALAQAKGLSTSDLVRNLISNAIGLDDEKSGDLTPKALSVVERSNLALQHEILAHFNKNDAWKFKYHTRMVEVLNKGFTAEYYKMFQEFDLEMSRRENDLVVDILQMFDVTERSLQALSDEESELISHPTSLTFRGFDFSDTEEGRLADYAKYLIEDGKWSSLAYHFDSLHEHGNSHFPMLAVYQRMLLVSKPLWEAIVNSFGGANEYKFSAQELDEISKAASWSHS